MSAILAGAVWGIAATIVALLPMRMQFVPGAAMLLAAPVLIAWLGAAQGWPAAAFGTFALVSMFRRPLTHYARKLRGRGEGAP